MAKQSGLGDNLYVHGYNLSGDIGSGEIGSPRATLDTTGIDKEAMERILALRDGTINYTAFFNPASVAGGDPFDQAHAVLSDLPTSDQILTYCRGTVIGSPAACLVAKELDYPAKRGNDGSLTFDVSSVANGYGLEWGSLLTAGRRTDTAATNGPGVDFGVGSPPLFDGSALFGAQFYLHVMAFTGTSVTVKIQESGDNGVGDAWTDVVGGGFAAATGIGAQRIETARNQTVERYLRAVTTGVFTNAVFAVVAVRNDVSVVF